MSYERTNNIQSSGARVNLRRGVLDGKVKYKVLKHIKFRRSDATHEDAKKSFGSLIRDSVIKSEWSQTEAADILCTDQPKVSQICSGKVQGFSLKRLFGFVKLLGFVIEIRVSCKEGRRYVDADTLLLDCKDQDMDEVKTFFVKLIKNVIKKKRWKQEEAAHVFGVDQPKISQICVAKVAGFSIERLITLSIIGGHKIECCIKPQKPNPISGDDLCNEGEL